MFRKLIAPALLIPLVVAVAQTARCAQQPAVDQAIKTAESWLKLVEEGSYRASWDQASTLFRNAVAEEQWDRQVGAVRQPLGAMRSRKLKAAKYASSLPGAPDGQYVVIQCDTSFENKKSAVETVTPMMDKDGQWHVSGYYIK